VNKWFGNTWNSDENAWKMYFKIGFSFKKLKENSLPPTSVNIIFFIENNDLNKRIKMVRRIFINNWSLNIFDSKKLIL